MQAESENLNSYDAVPYSSYPYAHSHPRNLAALGVLFGMSPPDVARCRVLEIGCAAGGNLLPMAVDFPDAQFIGIDASQRQVANGQRVIDDLSLPNITLHAQDVLNFDAEAGEFDFIICHGVYSWVPAEVQQKILAVCRDHLSANGVAYVSYNTYPGWYLRRGVREMMSYHAAGFDETQSKIDQSRALLNFLNSAVASDGEAYPMLLREELNVLSACEDSYLFHEHLESCNEPLFFYQFIERAEQVDLRFLCEASFSSMIPHGFSAEVQQTLAEIAPGIIQMEQYLDFIRNRKFRQTLLCHQDVSLTRVIEPERLQKLFVAAPLSPPAETGHEAHKLERTFTHASGRSVTVTTPIQELAFMYLSRNWPEEVSVEVLAEHVWQALPVAKRVSRDRCLAQLSETLLECYSSQLAELFACPSQATSTIHETPNVGALTRYLALQGEFVTNTRHETVKLNTFDRQLIQLLDGSLTLSELTRQMLQAASQHTTAGEGTTPPTESEMRAAIHRSLKQFSHAALLLRD
jgi:methyltransferase-like protein/trans-aconitate methyltransferase